MLGKSKPGKKNKKITNNVYFFYTGFFAFYSCIATGIWIYSEHDAVENWPKVKN